jgi:hypothetical protein
VTQPTFGDDVIGGFAVAHQQIAYKNNCALRSLTGRFDAVDLENVFDTGSELAQ